MLAFGFDENCSCSSGCVVIAQWLGHPCALRKTLGLILSCAAEFFYSIVQMPMLSFSFHWANKKIFKERGFLFVPLSAEHSCWQLGTVEVRYRFGDFKVTLLNKQVEKFNSWTVWPAYRMTKRSEMIDHHIHTSEK